jgi:hypothetical protein
MQFHQLTIGRNVGDKVDAIAADTIVKKFSELVELYGCLSFSAFQGVGYWNGQKESIVRLEVFGLQDSQVKSVAAWLAYELQQDAVMLLSVNSRPKFIGASERLCEVSHVA